MGVSGCGKTSVGAALALSLGGIYIDGDDLHPAANVAKMSRGQPLTDDDRWPWLSVVGERLRTASDATLIGCSALKRSYRDHITRVAQAPVLFLHLDGSPELIAERMAARSGHFMPPALLQSQFEALEPPAVDEFAVTISIGQPLERIVREITTLLEGDKS
ncbi:gluconokinase [Halomonas sp. M5N1S17]|uniref:gluconokinase n=1 Tax=Halomonas alkalisoli TaxID=2907158 RepID=UPI001F30265B|nr:gluconokinase [Halomonas alkalisoli]MCE9664880.1 gluconokinase [Halomonas alkalisoli]